MILLHCHELPSHKANKHERDDIRAQGTSAFYSNSYMKRLEITFLYLHKFQLNQLVPTYLICVLRKNKLYFLHMHKKLNRNPRPLLLEGPSLSYEDQTKPLHCTPHPTCLHPCHHPTEPTCPGRGRAARTCDGHIADTLLVHGGHQDHGLRWHDHGCWQRLKHTKDDHVVTEKHTTHQNHPTRGNTGPGAQRCPAATEPVHHLRMPCPH